MANKYVPENSLDDAVVLKRLIESKNEELSAYKGYLISISSEPNSSREASFKQCIDSLKALTDVQYNFQVLTDEAQKLKVSRRDYRNLCDNICQMLGDKIQELCIVPVYSQATNYENACPYSSNSFIMYTTKPVDIALSSNRIIYDGNLYKMIETKREETPYYTIYGTLLELTKR